jgi:DNA polymerase III alpha subunit
MSLDSASTPEAFAAKEVELGSGALCCTDHGSLSAAYKTFELAKKNKLIPTIGLEFYFRDDNCPILAKLGVPKTETVPRGMDKDKWKLDHPDGSFYDYLKYFHGTLGFQTYDAYLKGVKLLSKADDRAEVHGSERKPLFTWEDIEELAATQTTLGSGCLVGMVSRHLVRPESPASLKVGAAKAYFERLHHLFGDRFYVELFPHRCTHDFVKGVFVEHYAEGYLSSVEKPITSRYYYGKTLRTTEGEFKAEELADKWNPKKPQKLLAVKDFRAWKELEYPRVIASVRKQEGFVQNECSPASPEGDIQWGANKFAMGMAKKYGIMTLCSDDSHFAASSQKVVQDVKLSQMGDWRMYGSYHRQSSQEAFEYFKTQHGTSEKEFESWIDNSYKWADGFKDFKFDSTLQLPTRFYPQDTLAYTKKLIEKHGRMPKNDPRYVTRLKQEIELFYRNGTVDLLPYFFTCEEQCKLYENQGVLVGSSRGSAGGVLLSYLLGITSIDPIQHGLSLDRFLTLDRITSHHMPDVDLDFSSRDLLCGKECDVIEVEAEDGTKHVLPEGFVVETDKGAVPIEYAVKEGAEIEKWW